MSALKIEICMGTMKVQVHFLFLLHTYSMGGRDRCLGRYLEDISCSRRGSVESIKVPRSMHQSMHRSRYLNRYTVRVIWFQKLCEMHAGKAVLKAVSQSTCLFFEIYPQEPPWYTIVYILVFDKGFEQQGFNHRINLSSCSFILLFLYVEMLPDFKKFESLQ